jgi:hypothetical protein
MKKGDMGGRLRSTQSYPVVTLSLLRRIGKSLVDGRRKLIALIIILGDWDPHKSADGLSALSIIQPVCAALLSLIPPSSVPLGL